MSIFCKHVFKDIDAELAYRTEIDEGSIVFPSMYLTLVDVYVITRKCLKCGKVEKKVIYVRV